MEEVYKLQHNNIKAIKLYSIYIFTIMYMVSLCVGVEGYKLQQNIIKALKLLARYTFTRL